MSSSSNIFVVCCSSNMHPAKKEAVQWITFPFYQGFDNFLIWPSLENDVSIYLS